MVAATEEKAIEGDSLTERMAGELAEYFSKKHRQYSSGSSVHYGDSLRHLNRKELNEAVRWVESWRRTEPSGEELARFLLMLLIAWYVQTDVEERFEKVFSEKFLSVLK
jgi:hypothetical protein